MIPLLAPLKRTLNPVKFLLSLGIVALGQPALIGWLGAVSAVAGFALFFSIDFPKRKFFFSSLWFAGIQLIQLGWMTSIEFQGYYILVVYVLLAAMLGMQFGLFTWTIPSQGTLSAGRIVASASLWACLEWSRLFFFCGFSLNPIGLALCHFVSSLQWASIWGILGLSFWVMLTNLVLLNVMRQRRGVATLYAASVAFLPYVFGFFHIQYHAFQMEKTGGKRHVALVQTALLPSEKVPNLYKMQQFISPFQQWHHILTSLTPLKHRFLDLIVLPEAVVPLQADVPIYSFVQVKKYLVALWGLQILSQFPPLEPPYAGSCFSNGVEEICVSNLFWSQTLCNHFNADVVVGLDYTDKSTRKNFNSAFYLRPHQSRVERYDKQILLPLAEYLPFSFLKQFTKHYGVVDFFTPGKGFKIWGSQAPFSPCICYEETFSGLIREAKLLGSQMVVNLTNDNYYPDSILHRQHLFHARLRTVENGIPLIRSCNAGISAVVNSLGQIVTQMDEGHAGVLDCQLNNYGYNPPFSIYGEWGVLGFLMFLSSCYWIRQWIGIKPLELKEPSQLPSP